MIYLLRQNKTLYYNLNNSNKKEYIEVFIRTIHLYNKYE